MNSNTQNRISNPADPSVIEGQLVSERMVYIEHHDAETPMKRYHVHPTVEVNFLHGCDMHYSFSGNEVTAPRRRLCLFWAAYPHRATSVSGPGDITNIHVVLAEFLRWALPHGLVADLLQGAVIAATEESSLDAGMCERWSGEISNNSDEWQRLHALELRARLYRLGLSGWETLLAPRVDTEVQPSGGTAVNHLEQMLRFVAANFTHSIGIDHVANSAGISRNHAIAIFRKFLGRTIREHITDLRLQHARMHLAESNAKILTVALNSGFGSLSAFYDTFHKQVGMSPAAFRRQATSS